MAAQPGWYSDPSGLYQARYWDGSSWTRRVREGTDLAADGAPQAADAEPRIAATSGRVQEEATAGPSTRKASPRVLYVVAGLVVAGAVAYALLNGGSSDSDAGFVNADESPVADDGASTANGATAEPAEVPTTQPESVAWVSIEALEFVTERGYTYETSVDLDAPTVSTALADPGFETVSIDLTGQGEVTNTLTDRPAPGVGSVRLEMYWPESACPPVEGWDGFATIGGAQYCDMIDARNFDGPFWENPGSSETVLSAGASITKSFESHLEANLQEARVPVVEGIFATQPAVVAVVVQAVSGVVSGDEAIAVCQAGTDRVVAAYRLAPDGSYEPLPQADYTTPDQDADGYDECTLGETLVGPLNFFDD